MTLDKVLYAAMLLFAGGAVGFFAASALAMWSTERKPTPVKAWPAESDGIDQ